MCSSFYMLFVSKLVNCTIYI